MPGAPAGSYVRDQPRRRGVPLQDIQDAMGHADRRTTRRYMATHKHLDRHATYVFAAWLRRKPGSDPAAQ